MGINFHILRFLGIVSEKVPLGKTLTIGRQQLSFPEQLAKKLGATSPSAKKNAYCEKLFCEHFGATSVDAVDNSDPWQDTIFRSPWDNGISLQTTRTT